MSRANQRRVGRRWWWCGGSIIYDLHRFGWHGTLLSLRIADFDWDVLAWFVADEAVTHDVAVQRYGSLVTLLVAPDGDSVG